VGPFGMQIGKTLFVPWFSVIFLFVFCGLILPVGAQDNEACLQCHKSPDLMGKLPQLISLHVKPDRFAQSIHAQKGVTCLDCHADITGLGKGKAFPHPKYLSPVDCSECHEDASKSYLKSVHAEARRKGQKLAPLCAACHDYHYVQKATGVALENTRNGTCLACHAPERSHNWLPEKEVHLTFIECLVCHTPKSETAVVLSLYDNSSKQAVDTGAVLADLGVTDQKVMAGLDKNKDEKVDLAEFNELAHLFRTHKVKVDFWGEMVAKPSVQDHEIALLPQMKACSRCHAKDAPLFGRVFLRLQMPSGKVRYVKADQGVLASPHVADFFSVEGGERLSIDQWGWGIVLAVLGLVILHLFIRTASSLLRQKRRGE